MAITVKYLTDLGIEKEVAEKIFAERGKEIEGEKAKLSDAEQKLNENQETLKTLTENLEKLKASSEKFEAMVKEKEEKEAKDAAEKAAREEAEKVEKRFNAAIGQKKFKHEAIRSDYLRKFGGALGDQANSGKSDEDIIQELTQNDQNAFEGVTVIKLEGGTTGKIAKEGKYASRAEVMAIKDDIKRQNAILSNPDLFPEIKNN